MAYLVRDARSRSPYWYGLAAAISLKLPPRIEFAFPPRMKLFSPARILPEIPVKTLPGPITRL
jgi:hypothetical protein